MIFELINPSDPICFEAADLELAALATVLVGRGQYAATAEVDGKLVSVPLFMLGGTDEWFQKNCNRTLKASLEARKAEIHGVLRSFQLGKPQDLNAYKLALSYIPQDKQEEFKAKWKEDRRSSMNDAVGYAWQCADELEGKAAGNVPAPRSVYTA